MILIKIDGLPIPYKAPYVSRRGAFNLRYKELEYYKWHIRSQWHQEIVGKELEVEYIYHMPIPKATSKIKTDQMLVGGIKHTKTPDLDNLDKFISDALQGVAIENDSQIWRKTSSKVYNLTPKTLIKIFV